MRRFTIDFTDENAANHFEELMEELTTTQFGETEPDVTIAAMSITHLDETPE